jgi:hypothetical protein
MARPLELLLGKFDHFRGLVRAVDTPAGLSQSLGLVVSDKQPSVGDVGLEKEVSATALSRVEIQELRQRFKDLKEVYERVVMEKSELHVMLEEAGVVKAREAAITAQLKAAKEEVFALREQLGASPLPLKRELFPDVRETQHWRSAANGGSTGIGYVWFATSFTVTFRRL